MSQTLKKLVSGAAGAVALTLLHEATRRRTPDAPRMDLLGMRSLRWLLEVSGMRQVRGRELHRVALVGDLVANTAYYSLVVGGSSAEHWTRGAGLGVAAGIVKVLVPGRIGLGDDASNRTNTNRALTVGQYLVGGLAAAAVASLLDRRSGAEYDKWNDNPATAPRATSLSNVGATLASRAEQHPAANPPAGSKRETPPAPTRDEPALLLNAEHFVASIPAEPEQPATPAATMLSASGAVGTPALDGESATLNSAQERQATSTAPTAPGSPAPLPSTSAAPLMPTLDGEPGTGASAASGEHTFAQRTTTGVEAPSGASADAPQRADAAAQEDDLKIIEGIGPKVATVVAAAGVTSFAQIAALDVERLREILRTAGIDNLDPQTWPMQAQLAAEGKKDELRALQKRIKHGRLEDERGG